MSMLEAVPPSATVAAIFREHYVKIVSLSFLYHELDGCMRVVRARPRATRTRALASF